MFLRGKKTAGERGETATPPQTPPTPPTVNASPPAGGREAKGGGEGAHAHSTRAASILRRTAPRRLCARRHAVRPRSFLLLLLPSARPPRVGDGGRPCPPPPPAPSSSSRPTPVTCCLCAAPARSEKVAQPRSAALYSRGGEGLETAPAGRHRMGTRGPGRATCA